jgi:hypothetical protein
MNTFLDEQPPNLALRRVGRRKYVFFLKERKSMTGWQFLAGRLARGRRGCEGDAAGFILFFLIPSHPLPFLQSCPLFSALTTPLDNVVRKLIYQQTQSLFHLRHPPSRLLPLPS